MRPSAALVLAACCLACSPPAPPPQHARSSTPVAPTSEEMLRRIRAEPSQVAGTAPLHALAAAMMGHDAAGMDAALGESGGIALPWPGPEEASSVPFLARRDWRRGAGRTSQDWLDLWSRIDVATLSLDGSGIATVVGRVIGTDAHGRREILDLRGHGFALGTPPLRLDGSSLVALRPLTTDVSAASGVERPDPSLMDRGGRGLLSHGAAAADVDGDGDIDVFATGLHQHALFLNRGDGTFEDVAARARVATTEAPACAPLFLDADGDGDEDLFVSGLGHQSLFENRLVPDGKLSFRDVSAAAGVQVERAAFSAAAGDVTGDGLPDIAVACYGDYGTVVPDSWVSASNGQPNLLFVNEGGLRFRESAAVRGCADARWSYSTLVADMDDDHDLDVVFANDFGGTVGLYVNENGAFRDEAAARGLGAPSYGMGLSLGDWNRDGVLDLHVTKASSPIPARVLGNVVPPVVQVLASGNSVYRGQAGGRFTLEASMPTGWSWGGGFVDLDNDGWVDLHVPGGFLTGTGPEDTDDLFWKQVLESQVPGGQTMAEFFGLQVPAIVERGASFAGHERDSVFLNVRGTWMDVSSVSGLDSETDGRAAVHADFDDDGDMDVFLRAMHSRAHVLLRNDIGSERGWLRVALRGTASGTDACGAVVRLTGEAGVVAQAKLCGSGFLSQDDPRLLFGLGEAASSGQITVTWPSGTTQAFPGVPARTSLLLVEGEPEARVVKESPATLGGSGSAAGAAR